MHPLSCTDTQKLFISRSALFLYLSAFSFSEAEEGLPSLRGATHQLVCGGLYFFFLHRNLFFELVIHPFPPTPCCPGQPHVRFSFAKKGFYSYSLIQFPRIYCWLFKAKLPHACSRPSFFFRPRVSFPTPACVRPFSGLAYRHYFATKRALLLQVAGFELSPSLLLAGAS